MLQAHPLFAGVFADTAALCDEIARGGYTEASFSSGETIAYAADSRQMALVLRGKIQIYSSDAARQVLLRTVPAGELVGAAGMFSSHNMPMSRMIALGSADILMIEEKAVRRLLDHSSAFRDNCLAFLADRIAFLNRKITTFTAGSAERRLALYLDSMAGVDNRFICPVSLSAMADMLDIGRASLYRALETLEQDGFLIRSGKEFTLHHRELLPNRYH